MSLIIAKATLGKNEFELAVQKAVAGRAKRSVNPLYEYVVMQFKRADKGCVIEMISTDGNMTRTLIRIKQGQIWLAPSFTTSYFLFDGARLSAIVKSMKASDNISIDLHGDGSNVGKKMIVHNPSGRAIITGVDNVDVMNPDGSLSMAFSRESMGVQEVLIENEPTSRYADTFQSCVNIISRGSKDEYEEFCDIAFSFDQESIGVFHIIGSKHALCMSSGPIGIADVRDTVSKVYSINLAAMQIIYSMIKDSDRVSVHDAKKGFYLTCESPFFDSELWVNTVDDTAKYFAAISKLMPRFVGPISLRVKSDDFHNALNQATSIGTEHTSFHLEIDNKTGSPVLNMHCINLENEYEAESHIEKFSGADLQVNYMKVRYDPKYLALVRPFLQDEEEFNLSIWQWSVGKGENAGAVMQPFGINLDNKRMICIGPVIDTVQ